MNRIHVLSAAVLFAVATLIASLPVDAIAQGGRAGGRIYNPKRLRPRAEKASRGRVMRDPRKAPASPRQPIKRRALIPHPEKQASGGKGYVKRGKYYYQKPSQIRAGSNTKRHVERVKIPHPNAKYR